MSWGMGVYRQLRGAIQIVKETDKECAVNPRSPIPCSVGCWGLRFVRNVSEARDSFGSTVNSVVSQSNWMSGSIRMR